MAFGRLESIFHTDISIICIRCKYNILQPRISFVDTTFSAGVTTIGSLVTINVSPEDRLSILGYKGCLFTHKIADPHKIAYYYLDKSYCDNDTHNKDPLLIVLP